MRSWILLLALAGLGVEGQQERPLRENYPKDGVIWTEEWSDALYESRWRNVPIHLAFHDQSEPSRSMTSTVYLDSKFIEASRMWVNVPVHAGSGHDIDVEIKGARLTVCERFWNIPCAVHVRHAALVTGFKDLTRRPTTIFTMMQLPELGRLEGRTTVVDLLKAQEKVLSSWEGARVPYAAWKEARDFRDDGDQFFKLKNWRKSIDAYLKIKKPKFPSLVNLGDDLLSKVNQQGEALLSDAIQEAEDPKKREAARKSLYKIVKEFSPLRVAEKARDAYEKLK